LMVAPASWTAEVRSALYTRIFAGVSANPKGILAQSPGLAAERPTLGKTSNPVGIVEIQRLSCI
jgi:hypothetical protein